MDLMKTIVGMEKLQQTMKVLGGKEIFVYTTLVILMTKQKQLRL